MLKYRNKESFKLGGNGSAMVSFSQVKEGFVLRVDQLICKASTIRSSGEVIISVGADETDQTSFYTVGFIPASQGQYGPFTVHAGESIIAQPVGGVKGDTGTIYFYGAIMTIEEWQTSFAPSAGVASGIATGLSASIPIQTPIPNWKLFVHATDTQGVDLTTTSLIRLYHAIAVPRNNPAGAATLETLEGTPRIIYLAPGSGAANLQPQPFPFSGLFLNTTPFGFNAAENNGADVWDWHILFWTEDPAPVAIAGGVSVFNLIDGNPPTPTP